MRMRHAGIETNTPLVYSEAQGHRQSLAISFHREGHDGTPRRRLGRSFSTTREDFFAWHGRVTLVAQTFVMHFSLDIVFH
jgi:hypothetical protein